MIYKPGNMVRINGGSIQSAKDAIAHLSALINTYNHDKTSVSDSEYDKKFKMLIKLEKLFPEFIQPNSPTQRIGNCGYSDTGIKPVSRSEFIKQTYGTFSDVATQEEAQRGTDATKVATPMLIKKTTKAMVDELVNIDVEPLIPIESVTLDGHIFSVAADAEINRKLGGFENEPQANVDSNNAVKSLAQTRFKKAVQCDHGEALQIQISSLKNRMNTVIRELKTYTPSDRSPRRFELWDKLTRLEIKYQQLLKMINYSDERDISKREKAFYDKQVNKAEPEETFPVAALFAYDNHKVKL